MENKNDDNTQNKSNTYNNNNQQDDKYIDTLSTPNWVSKEWREKQQATLNPTPPPKKPVRVYRQKRNYNRLIALIIIILCIIMGFVFASDNDSSNNDNSFATKQGHSFNIMLMGVDRRADDVGRSDTLMVLTYNPNEQKASLLSLPRDTRVHIEKNDYDKINHAYAYGGHELTKKTVESFLNVPINYYVLIDIQAFEKIIDAVGGVDIDVEKRMYYEDPWDDDGGLYIDLQPGMQHMDGKTAITYVRYRDEEGDIGRIKRQQNFMKAVMDKLVSPTIIPKLPSIVSAVSDSVETDMSVSEILSFIGTLQEAKNNGLKSDMIPGKPVYIEDVSYWVPDIKKTRQILANTLGVEIDNSMSNSMYEDAVEYKESIPENAEEITVTERTKREIEKEREERLQRIREEQEESLNRRKEATQRIEEEHKHTINQEKIEPKREEKNAPVEEPTNKVEPPSMRNNGAEKS